MLLDNLKDVLSEISKGNNLGEKITLVGATKTMPVEDINLAIKNGLPVVAENKAQEFRDKHDFILGGEQHFIGHLQTNKVKYLVGNVKLIQSVDSFKLGKVISAEAIKKNVTQDVLAEINIGGELSKSGYTFENAKKSVLELTTLPNVKVTGLMAMLPRVNDQNLLEDLCQKMRALYDELKNLGLPFTYLSMGMSADWKIAIKNGSNMIRLGSVIFGKRNYTEKI